MLGLVCILVTQPPNVVERLGRDKTRVVGQEWLVPMATRHRRQKDDRIGRHDVARSLPPASLPVRSQVLSECVRHVGQDYHNESIDIAITLSVLLVQARRSFRCRNYYLNTYPHPRLILDGGAHPQIILLRRTILLSSPSMTRSPFALRKPLAISQESHRKMQKSQQMYQGG